MRRQDVTDLFAEFLRRSPEFRGKGRLIAMWQQRQRPGAQARSTRWGFSMTLDTSIPYEAMAWLDREERAELDHLGRMLRPGDTFVDVGANLGLWTLRAAQLVGPAGRVWAVEPNPAVFDRLAAHIAANHLDQVVVPLALAAGPERSEGVLEASATHNVATVRSTGLDRAGGAVVEIHRLDDLIEQPNQITGVKLDVEGGELGALQGSARLLRRWRPWICVEFNTTLTTSSRLGEWPVHQFLVDQGYEESPCIFGDPSSSPIDSDWTPRGYHNLQYLPRTRSQ